MLSTLARSGGGCMRSRLFYRIDLLLLQILLSLSLYCVQRGREKLSMNCIDAVLAAEKAVRASRPSERAAWCLSLSLMG